MQDAVWSDEDQTQWWRDELEHVASRLCRILGLLWVSFYPEILAVFIADEAPRYADCGPICQGTAPYEGGLVRQFHPSERWPEVFCLPSGEEC